MSDLSESLLYKYTKMKLKMFNQSSNLLTHGWVLYGAK